MSRTILEIESLYKTYGEKENAAEALRGISFQVYQGEFLGIMGSSGSWMKNTYTFCKKTPSALWSAIHSKFL